MIFTQEKSVIVRAVQNGFQPSIQPKKKSYEFLRDDVQMVIWSEGQPETIAHNRQKSRLGLGNLH